MYSRNRSSGSTQMSKTYFKNLQVECRHREYRHEVQSRSQPDKNKAPKNNLSIVATCVYLKLFQRVRKSQSQEPYKVYKGLRRNMNRGFTRN